MNGFRLVEREDPLIRCRLLGGDCGFSRRCCAIAEIESISVLDEPASERGQNGFADSFAMFENVGVPEAQNGIAERLHEIVTGAVVGAVRVLRAIDFDDEPPLAACEIREIGANRQLACEAIAAELSVLQFQPKKSFGLIAALAKLPGASGCSLFATATGYFDAFPHSVAASQRHLSPLRRERKGARLGEFAPFLSPVDRGRGGRRSRPEWGSIRRRHPQKSVGAPPSALRFSTKASSSSRMAGSMWGAS